MRSVGEYLGRWGGTPQKPLKRAYEQQPKAVKAWLGDRADRIEAFYLPSYSPELNPDERLNADLKHAIGPSKSKSGSLSKERRMALGHERLDVYRLAIGYVAWVYGKAATLEGIHRAARDQWLRASQSIPLNIAEGNGKTADADRRRYFKIARGSALECAAIQDVLVVGKALDEAESQERKNELDRMVSTSATSEPVRRRRMGVRSAAVSLLPT